MTGYAYLSMSAEPFAEYYFDRILRHYPDLLVKGRSVHFLCLKNLIRISKTSSTRIAYFNEMINRFPSEVSVTELYYRRALEYEKDSEWEAALRSFAQFLEQPDAPTIQIAGEPNAYSDARRLVSQNCDHALRLESARQLLRKDQLFLYVVDAGRKRSEFAKRIFSARVYARAAYFVQ